MRPGRKQKRRGQAQQINDRGLVVEVDPSPALPVSMTAYAYTFEPMHDPPKAVFGIRADFFHKGKADLLEPDAPSWE